MELWPPGRLKLEDPTGWSARRPPLNWRVAGLGCRSYPCPYCWLSPIQTSSVVSDQTVKWNEAKVKDELQLIIGHSSVGHLPDTFKSLQLLGIMGLKGMGGSHAFRNKAELAFLPPLPSYPNCLELDHFSGGENIYNPFTDDLNYILFILLTDLMGWGVLRTLCVAGWTITGWRSEAQQRASAGFCPGLCCIPLDSLGALKESPEARKSPHHIPSPTPSARQLQKSEVESIKL